MSKLLEGLNEQQQLIVKQTEGYKLVLAGAGSGKTRTLTYSIAYLLEQNLAKPNNILAVTFTNKAASEMKERIDKLVGIKQKNSWWIGTFHGICVRILVRYGTEIGISKYFSIADEKEQLRMIKELIDNNTQANNLEPDSILGKISWAKNNLITPTELIQSKEHKTNKIIGEIYAQYQEKMQSINALDFDDLIMKTVQLLDLVPKVKEKLQKQFKYVLVKSSAVL